MSTVINTNLASLFAQNSLSNAQTNLATSVQRLSSGLRINSAKDDAAGLAIAQNMQSQLNGTNQSIQNLSNATNLLQTADTSLSTIQDMLLRMKQLSTQGYDGSLNATQMQDVVQQMGELRTEINQTAQRTQFNGISLLALGSSVDRVNGAVYAGQYLTTTRAVINDNAAFSTTTSLYSSSTVLNDAIDAYNLAEDTSVPNFRASNTGESISYQITLSNDDVVRENPGNYSFRAVGDQLTLSYTGADGIPKQQSVTIEAAPYDSEDPKNHIQRLNFDKFGISMVLTTTADAGGPTVLASDIADAFDGRIFNVTGQASKITDIQTSGAAAGSYSFWSDGNTLGLDWTDTSDAFHSTSIDLLNADFAAGSDSSITFKDAGITLKIHNFQAQTGAQIAGLIENLTDTHAGNAGTLNIVNPGTSSLEFQSGPKSNAYIAINTLNVQTDTTGQFTGNNLSMLSVGTSMDVLGQLNGRTETPDWQAAFKNASAAIDEAIDYISTQRSVFGSQMNRLSYITTNLTAQSTNLQSSKSAIMDTNFASETATLTKGQIMQQAATAMLAQANQMPNVILSLLK